MADAKPKIKAYVSDFTIVLGPIMASGRLVPVKATGAEDYKEFFSICPEDHSEPTPVEGGQRYICKDTIDLSRDKWHVHTQSELDKARKVGDKLVAVSKDEIDEAKKADEVSLGKNVLRLTVHPKDDVWNATWPAGSAYVFIPKVANEFYSLMVRLIQDSGKAFVGLCNLRNNEGLFRLDVWQDMIVVQKMLDPSGLNPTEPIQANVEQDDLDGYLAMLDKKVKPFDPSNYRTGVRERLEALTAALEPATESVPVTKASETKKSSLADMLAGWGDED